MVRPEIIRRRLQRFGEYLTILERFQRYDLEAFLSDPEHYGSAERTLRSDETPPLRVNNGH